jgi:hypothetical protein
MLSIALAAALMAQAPADGAPPCKPVAGAEALWAKPETRFVIVGEMHGTAEAPAAFADLVCLASRDKPVAVAVEGPAAFADLASAYVNSDGGAAARSAFLADIFWTQPFKDGRSSQAMLGMFEELQRLRRAGRDISLFGFMPDGGRPAGFDQSYYELEMAHLLSKGAQARPAARVLALIGNLHALKTPMEPWGGGLPAAAHLSPKDAISLRVATGPGTAWNCQGPTPAECGPYPTRGSAGGRAPGVVLERQDGGDYDGLLVVGPATASPPAVR